VNADAIHPQNGLNPSVRVRKGGGALVGQLGKLLPIVNRPTAAFAAGSGGSQPPRRLPAQCHLVLPLQNICTNCGADPLVRGRRPRRPVAPRKGLIPLCRMRDEDSPPFVNVFFEFFF